MVRVLHVIDSLDLGGAQTALLNLVKYADRRRFHHEVAAMHGRGVFAEAFEAAGVPMHSLSRRRFPPGYLVNLPRLLGRGGFDVVHCHLFGANWIARPIAAMCGVRCRYNHDQCNDAFRSESALVTAFDRVVNRLSTRVLAVSRSVEQFLRSAERLPEERVSYLPNAVDLGEFFRPSGDQRRAARKRFDLPEDAVVIGGVGRLTHQKNFGLLLDAVRPLLAENRRVLVALFGGGPDEGILRERAGDFGGRVRFMGTVPDRAAIYHALDLLVMPSRYEGLPMALLEAMAAGVPVVASAVDGVREIVKDGREALLVASGDMDGFRVAIRNLLGDAPLRERLVLAARESVEKQFDARKLAARLEALYLADLEKEPAKHAKRREKKGR